MAVLFKLKDHFKENKLYINRTTVAAVLILGLVFILLCRLIFLQVYKHDMYVTLAHNNQVRMIPTSPIRGLIYDRNGILLADNIPTFSLEIVPSQAKNLEQVIGKLAKVVTITPNEIKVFRKHLKCKGQHESIPIRSKLTNEEVARFSVKKHQFPGIEVIARLLRNYPHGKIFAHALGYMGPISETDLTKIDISKYRGIHQIGKDGIERSYEDILRGTIGYEQVETDARGRTIRTLSTTLPISGKNIHLTLDMHLQTAAHKALGNDQGAIVAIDTKTGNILALVSNPSYDPNLFVQGINSEAYQQLQKTPKQPLFNRAINGQYPPGSIVKPLIALQALEQGIITPKERIYDPGYYQLKEDGRLFRNLLRKAGHGFINIEYAIAESCTTFFYYIADKLGIDLIYEIYNKFGFGQPVNIELLGESHGIAPSRTWKKKIKHTSWYPGETLITGIGQGYTLVTPVQIAQAAAIIANKGQRIQPRLVQAMQIQGGSVEPLEITTKTNVEINNKKNWDVIIKGMELSIKSPRGTAHRIHKTDNLRIAGKTGTAQVFSLKEDEEYDRENLHKNLRDHAWFMAFAPVNDPKIAIAVIIEHGKGSSTVARAILDNYLQEQPHG